MQEDDLKIDVGEADEQETEIDLDAKPEPQEEPKEELEVQQVEEQPKEAAPVENQKQELDDYSEGVQKRIAKLTRKMREAERQKEEAIQYAQTVKTEADNLRTRFSNLDKSYTEEFEKRVTTNLEAAKAKLANAIANADAEGQAQAQLELAELASDNTRLATLKAAFENKVEEPVATQTPAARTAQPAAPDPRADAWAAKNPWFGTDNAMTYTAFDIHKQLIQEGYDANTGADEYYTEIDKRIRLEFPHKFDTNKESTSEPVQNVASAKRSAGKGRRKTVKLTPSQVAISKRLGVPLEEYAKQLAAKEV
jgi:hypothetical protein